MTDVPAISIAAVRLERAMVKEQPAVALTPAEVELIIFLIPILLNMIYECTGKTMDDELMEERAYKFLTTRRPVLDYFVYGPGGRARIIREKAGIKWIRHKGNFDSAESFGNVVEKETRSIDRSYFHTLWAEARKRYAETRTLPQGGSGTTKSGPKRST